MDCEYGNLDSIDSKCFASHHIFWIMEQDEPSLFKSMCVFGWLGWKYKSRVQHLLHMCFQNNLKCEKIIWCDEFQTTPSKKLVHLGLISSVKQCWS